MSSENRNNNKVVDGWVGKRETYNCQHGSDKSNRQSTAAKPIRPDLARVGDQKRRERDIVPGEEHKKHGDNRDADAGDLRLCERTREAGDDDVAGQHGGCGSEEQHAATQLVDHGGGADGEDEVPDLQTGADEGLVCD